MAATDVVRLAQDLIRFNTVNPPGNEQAAALFMAGLLESAGFAVKLHKFAEQRLSLVADMPGRDERAPLCLSGHLDTVGLGTEPWRVDPFAAEIADGRLYGRGSTDMKGGIAALVSAALETQRTRRSGLKIVLTAGEETGCDGARHLRSLDALGEARAIIIAEPTSNEPCFGHRGVLWLQMEYHGRAAHGSTPDRGDNAVIKAARAIGELEQFGFDVTPHDHLGSPSLSIGYCHGGQNINVVPDRAEIGLDIRTTPNVRQDDLRDALRGTCKADALHVHLDLPPVFTDPGDTWMQHVLGVASDVCGRKLTGGVAPYFTDASILGAGYGHPPIAILGPGELAQAHCTDESCAIQRLEEARDIYVQILKD